MRFNEASVRLLCATPEASDEALEREAFTCGCVLAVEAIDELCDRRNIFDATDAVPCGPDGLPCFGFFAHRERCTEVGGISRRGELLHVVAVLKQAGLHEVCGDTRDGRCVDDVF